MPRRAARPASAKTPKAYDHKETEAVLRPDIGIQAQFKKKKEPAKYRYDRSLDPQLSWDISADREHAEASIQQTSDCGSRIVELSKAPASVERDKEIEKLRSK